MDLWWDADRIVFGYAKAKTDEPPAGWLDRAHELSTCAAPRSRRTSSRSASTAAACGS